MLELAIQGRLKVERALAERLMALYQYAVASTKKMLCKMQKGMKIHPFFM